MIPRSRGVFASNLNREQWRKAWRAIRLYRKGEIIVTRCEDYNIEDMLAAAHCHNMRDRRIERTLQERLMLKRWMDGFNQYNVGRWGI